MNTFDNAESAYLNSYKDLKDRMNEQYTKRIEEIFIELMQSPGAINDAVKHGCGENEMFGVQLLQYKDDAEETHNLIWTYIEKYMLDDAERLAESE